jgi:hypothetical protein
MSEVASLENNSSGNKRTRWHALTSIEVLSLLNSRETGLLEEEAAARLAKYGPNSIPRKFGESAPRFGIRQN